MNKKILVCCMIIIIIIIIGLVCCFVYNISKTNVEEIDLSNITVEEILEIKRLNFFELEEYPPSIEFISLKKESQVRETQFSIKFSVSSIDNEKYNLEKNVNESPNEITIIKISEEEETIIYEMHTNFAQNSKEDKWSYLYTLIDKYNH